MDLYPAGVAEEHVAGGVVGEVVVCGHLEYLEIWNREEFEKHLAEEPFGEEDFGDLSAKGI